MEHFTLKRKKAQLIYLNIFYKKMKRWEHFPRKVSYYSPEIQDEVIDTMAQVVQDSTVLNINASDVAWYALLEDYTRD